MDRQAGNPRVNTGKALFATVGVSAVGAQSPYPSNNRGQTGKDFPHIICYQGVDVSAVGRQTKRLLHSIVEPLHVLLCVFHGYVAIESMNMWPPL